MPKLYFDYTSQQAVSNRKIVAAKQAVRLDKPNADREFRVENED